MRVFLTLFCFLLLSGNSKAQISAFPYVERFDTVAVPALPFGWTTTTNRSASGDFITSTSTPRSTPNCIFSQNATLSQTLTSPTFNFTNRTPNKLEFYSSRSSTHTAGLVMEASTDNGVSWPFQLADTIRNPGTTSYVLTSIALPGSLFNQPTVRFRWRLVGIPSGGPNGTFRLDDVSLTVLTTYDVAVIKLASTPNAATIRDSLALWVTVKNLGAQPASGYSVKFFRDANSNQIPEISEQFSSVGGNPILPGDSAIFSVNHPPLRAGDHRFYAIISFSQDENALNDSLSTLLSIGYAKGALLINEIMYAPVGDEPEWVELYNPSPDTVNVKNWRISDISTTTKTLITSVDAFIPPAGYGLVAKDANISLVHPGITAPIFLAGFAALNNTTPDAVVIYDARSISIDSVLYAPSWGGQNGKSLERIDTDVSSVIQSNWSTSSDSTGSTPGKFNSVGRLQFDLAVGQTSATPTTLNQQFALTLNAYIRNLGKLAASSFSVSMFADTNKNGIGEPSELLQTTTPASSIPPGDSLLVSYQWTSPPAGETRIIVRVDYAPDLRTGNNSAQFRVRQNYPVRSLVINEIMYDPLTGQNEWLEFYHRGSAPVDLANWKFSDRPTPSGSVNTFTISSLSRIVQPGDFVVVAAESTILQLYPNLQSSSSNLHLFISNRPGGFSLGNDGDDVVLKDLTDSTIDSVSYSPRWHHPDVADAKGRSLERINPDLETNDRRNWSTATGALGGSPGKANTILTSSLPTSASITISPNPFSPDNDGFEDFCSVQYNLPSSTSLIRIRIYDIKGRLIRTLANAEFSGATGEVIWDGLDEDRQRARIGPYVVFIEALDSQGGVVHTAKAVAVVATKF